MCFSPPIKEKDKPEKHLNPKRMQRAIHESLSQNGIGTKAQQALKLQQEQTSKTRKKHQQFQNEQIKEQQFLLRMQKKKEKHRGR